MKLTIDEEKRLQLQRDKLHREYEQIYTYWLSVQDDYGATEKTCKKFGCGNKKVLAAMSYCLKFTESGIFKK